MDAAHRRMEIISILAARGHATMGELAWELDVSRRTIMNDVMLLSFDYPIYTKQGEGGGVFITENYKPYANTLTQTELETLCKIYGRAEGKEKEILFRIIHKYGADKLKI
jgi:predicted DNA-binding transcriptional regulator YafY